MRALPMGMVLATASLMALNTGCDSLDRAKAPEFSPRTAAAKAIELYDTNGDGRLDAEELKQAPSLAANLATFDSDGDGGLTADEIQARLQEILRDGARVDNALTILLDGRPLRDAEVRLVPDAFLADGLPPAKGTTDAHGSVQPVSEGVDYGIFVGVYRVEVTKSGQNLPARYNTDTVLGVEMTSLTDYDDESYTYRLTSR